MSVHRICIQADRDGDPVAVDVALPSGAPVGELLPAIVDMVDDRTVPNATVQGWRLDRPSGGALLESGSLIDNGVHDGELLILAPVHAPTLGLLHLEPCREVAAARLPSRGTGRSLPGVVCVLATVLAAVALAWTGVSTQPSTNLIVAAVGACAAVTASLATGHPTALSMAAVALASATGFLAVPSGPAAPNAFLAAAAAFSASLLLLRLSGRPSSALTATATLSVLIAVVTLMAFPVVAVGTVLSTASLGMLALAPRIAVLVAGLGPDHWTDEMGTRAAAGHATLTGLVAGCAAGAALGAALASAAGLRYGAPTHGTVAFAALVGVVLLLRARTYVQPKHQNFLVAGGLASAVSCFGVTVVTYPDHVGWACGVLVAVGLFAARRPRIGAAVSRLVDLLEYAALAAVVPVALWVGGAYALVGEVQLP